MNRFIRAVQSLDYDLVKQMIGENPKCLQWSEKSGKNALHYLAGLVVPPDKMKSEASLKIARLLLKKGMDINSVHRISEKDGFFPATPVWYAYTRGRNEKLYKYLLRSGANPDHCMFAIAWNDDVKAAELFKKYGAKLDGSQFIAAFYWKKLRMAEWFLKNGADVNHESPQGHTALLLAVKRKAPLEQIKLLLEYGADGNKKNKSGESPVKLAGSTRQKKVLELLQAY